MKEEKARVLALYQRREMENALVRKIAENEWKKAKNGLEREVICHNVRAIVYTYSHIHTVYCYCIILISMNHIVCMSLFKGMGPTNWIVVFGIQSISSHLIWDNFGVRNLQNTKTASFRVCQQSEWKDFYFLSCRR